MNNETVRKRIDALKVTVQLLINEITALEKELELKPLPPKKKAQNDAVAMAVARFRKNLFRPRKNS